MSYTEFQGWQSYYSEEPFLADRIEIQLAKIGQVTALTGMGKIDLPEDFFYMCEDLKTGNKRKKDDLESKLKALFGVGAA